MIFRFAFALATIAARLGKASLKSAVVVSFVNGAFDPSRQ